MSVINKMLRDLDQRHAPDDQPAPRASAATLRKGTASLGQDLAVPGRRQRVQGVLVAGVVGVGLLAAGLWWTFAHRTGTSAPVPLTSLVPEPAVLVPKTLPVAVKVSAPVLARPVPAPAPVVVAVHPAAATATATATATASASTEGVTHGSLPKAPAPAEVTADAPAVAQRQQQAARDALAQAQTLWNAGSHDAATDLLQQAVAMAERSATSTPSLANTQTLAGLARELARMHLADGRAAAAADLLARLQPQLGQEADIWALRANAAQRLGRHQESVNDYTTALQSRPNEQRWLLGAAVSLAAQGQTANATAMAERARAVGPIAAEVQAYLHQMGVQLKTP